MSRNMKNKTAKKHAGTQTSIDVDAGLEIARLQEQVKLLTIENKILRKYTVEQPSDVLKEESPTKSLQSRAAKISPENVVESIQEKKIRNQSISKSAIKNVLRGCSCKGNCSSKMCGCVKKDFKCGDGCRCNNSVCQNQDPGETDSNKENMGNINADVQQMDITKDKRIQNKRLSNVHHEKSLFSPDIAGSEIDLDEAKYRPSSIHFGSRKTLSFASDDETDNKEQEIIEKRSKRGKSSEKESQRERGRPKKNNLKVPKTQSNRKLRSLSNEEKKGKTDMTIETHSLRKCSSSELDIQSDKSNDSLPEPKETKTNYLRNIVRGMEPLWRGKQTLNEKNKVNNITERSSNLVASHVTVDTVIKPNEKLLRSESEITDIFSSPEEGNQSISTTTNSDKETPNKERTNFENNVHLESDRSSEFEEDSSFNPMQPRRQLIRTPTHNSSTETNPQNISEILLPLPAFQTKEELEEEYSIHADLDQAEVDLNEFQSQLIACKKCKRTFHPRRIKRHESCCKNV